MPYRWRPQRVVTLDGTGGIELGLLRAKINRQSVQLLILWLECRLGCAFAAAISKIHIPWTHGCMSSLACTRERLRLYNPDRY